MDDQEIAMELGRSGLSVSPNFLPFATLQTLQEDFKQSRDRKLFRPAAIGAGKNPEVNGQERRDEIYWIDQATATSAQESLLLRMASLQQALNRNLFLGLREFEGHYAAYSAGGFYHRHLDSIRDTNSRMVSVVLYLNTHWKIDDGGQLRVYHAANRRDTTIDPIGGTLVCFLSKISEHEVLESFADRISFTGWFKT
jgi:SM-20-related protein